MALVIVSPDITLLDFKVLLDMSLAIPTIKITNQSTEVNPGSLKWVFEVLSPGGTPIHIGNFLVPDVNSNFTSFTLVEQLPQIFRQLEFSNVNQYSVKVYVKDSLDNIYDLTKAASICKPNGNNGQNNFGSADIHIEAKCAQGKLFITDSTNLIYKSLVGTKVSTTVKVSYPKDEDGNQIPDVTVAQLPALVNIHNGGDGYGVYAAHVYDYDLGDNFFVRVRYTYNNKSFPVWCNVDLCPLFCEFDKLLNMVHKNCDTATRPAQDQRITIINGKIHKAVVGILQPLCGFDVPAIIEEIKEIGGFTCDCCRPAGLSNLGSVSGSDLVLAVNKLGGDMELQWIDNGNGNWTLNYYDYTYTFSICVGTSQAFEFRERNLEYTKNTCLFVDMTILATDILTEIQGNSTLTNLINSIVNQTALNCSVDAQGLFNQTCNYVTQVNASTGTNTMFYVIINGTQYDAPGNILVTQEVQIAAWLNSLGLGTFTASYDLTTKLTTISSIANTNIVSTIRVLLNGSSETGGPIYLFSSSCGSICSVLQSIINYLADLNLLQITIGGKVNVCSINSDGSVTTTEFLGDESAYLLAQALGNASCNAAAYMSARGLSPENLRGQFAEWTAADGAPIEGDYFLMSIGGKLIKAPLEKVGLGIFSLLSSDAAVKDMYCAGSMCTNVNDCSPVTNLAISPGDTSALATWTQSVGAVGYKWSLDGVNYNSVVGTTVSIPALTASTNYSFRIYPEYNNGNGLPCQVTLAFLTTNAAALCAIMPDFIADNLTDTSGRLTWTAVAGATGYQYRIDGGPWVSVGNVEAIVVSGLSPNTSYDAQGRAIIGATPCPQIASVTFSTTNSQVILANNMTVGAAAYVISKLSINTVNIYGAAPLATGGTANVTVPLIATLYTYTITVVSDVPSAGVNVRINHKRGASTLHTKVLAAAGAGVATDISFDLAFAAQAGDVFEAVIG